MSDRHCAGLWDRRRWSADYHDERHEWTQYAFDQREVAKVGVRSRGWTAIGAIEVECLLEMARCLRELGEGRTPL